MSSITGGRATFTMNFAGYEKVPSEVQEELLKAYQETIIIQKVFIHAI